MLLHPSNIQLSIWFSGGMWIPIHKLSYHSTCNGSLTLTQALLAFVGGCTTLMTWTPCISAHGLDVGSGTMRGAFMKMATHQTSPLMSGCKNY